MPLHPVLRRARPLHPFRADPSHRFALIGVHVEQMTRDRRLDYSSGHRRRVLRPRQYVVFDVDTTQLCTFFVYTPEHREVKVTLDPLALTDVGSPLLSVGDWRVLPGQLSIYRRLGDFVCCQCLQTSSRAPCFSCFGPSGEDHSLVSDFTTVPSVLEAATAAAAPGLVSDDLVESAPDGAGLPDFPEVSLPAGPPPFSPPPSPPATDDDSDDPPEPPSSVAIPDYASAGRATPSPFSLVSLCLSVSSHSPHVSPLT